MILSAVLVAMTGYTAIKAMIPSTVATAMTLFTAAKKSIICSAIMGKICYLEIALKIA
ncbi:hypothetical protein [Microcoleus vaginatus]|uniref:hypothetical protein n=1 Tax=Microcoleus vaginatus TaxID=119532 RepID=UPI004040C286